MGRLRLLIGPPGSGKTQRLLAEIAAEAAREPLGPPAAPPLVLLVPEQQTAQLDRAVLAALAERGTAANARVQVLSFRWLARRLELAAGESRGSLSDHARRLLVWKLLGEIDPEQYSDDRVRSETASLLSGLLAEAAECATTSAALRQRAELLANANPRLASKTQLLADVLERFERHCSDHGLSFAAPPARIPLLLSEANWPLLAGTRVWVDGFSGFTGAEELALKALLAQCDSVTVSLLLDPQRRDGPLAADTYDWYAPTRELYTRWGELARAADCSFDYDRDVIALNEPLRWPARSPLRQLAVEGLQGGNESADPKDVTSVTAIVCGDERVEAEAAAREIRRLTLPTELGGAGLRYGQISLAVRSLAPYAELLRLAMREHGIPVFIDQRRSIAYHPVCELLRCGLRLALGCAEREDVYALLKCGLLGLQLETDERERVRRTDILENHARAVGLRPSEWIQSEPWQRWPDPDRDHAAQLAQLDGWRRELLAPVIALHGLLSTVDHSPTVRSVLEHAWPALIDDSVKTELQRWSDAAADPTAAELHSHVLQPLADLLDELVAVAGELVVAPAELCRWLEAGLAGLSLGFPPPRLDSVLITEIERGRHNEVAATLLLGLADDSWPAPVKQAAIFSDEERLTLNGAGRLLPLRGLEASRREPYLALVACTRPTQFLWLSRPAADGDGRGRAASPFFSGVVAALRLKERSFDSAAPTTTAGTAHDLVVAAAQAPQDAALQSAALSLAEAVPDALRGLHWARARIPADKLPPGLVADLLRLQHGPPELDIRQLEALGACPFRHYAQWLVGLQRREQATATPGLTQFYRKLFARTLTLLRDTHYDWQARRPEPIRESANQALAELAEDLLAHGAGTQHLLQRAGWLLDRLTSELAELPSGRVPLLIDQGYGSGRRLDPLVVETPLGQVRVRGRIDRLDAANDGVTVVATHLSPGKVALDWKRFSAGADLALPAALLAARGLRSWDPDTNTESELQPKAAEVSRVEPHWEQDIAQFAAAPLRPSFARDSANAKLDGLTANVLAETQRQLTRLAERLLDGEIAIQPLRCGTWTACSACQLRPVCRFDPAVGEEYREVQDSATTVRDRIATGEVAEANP